MIDPQILQRVRAEVSILEFARECGLVLEKRGSDWWCRCPFHEERSGSCKFNEKRNAFKCFGCGLGGDVVRFYLSWNQMDSRHDFPRAVKALAAKAGIPVDDDRTADWKPKPKRRSRQEKEAEREYRRARALAIRAENSLRKILERGSWDRYEMWEESAIEPGDLCAQASALLGLFDPTDIVWCGEHAHSISAEDAADPENRKRMERLRALRPFRSASEWIKQCEAGVLPGPRICPNAFKSGVLSRSDDAVLHRRFLVIEHDKLSLNEQGAALRWLWKEAGLCLRAVVFTGGKSLHGWFDCPAPGRMKDLQIALVGARKQTGEGRDLYLGGMGFDRASFVPSQPYRIPGWKHDRTGEAAELWFLGGT